MNLRYCDMVGSGRTRVGVTLVEPWNRVFGGENFRAAQRDEGAPPCGQLCVVCR